MASSVATDLLLQKSKYELYHHDPDGTTAAIVTPDGGTTEEIVDLKEYDNFLVAAIVTALTGNGMTKLEIVANDEADFSGTTVVIKDSGTIAADALGDWAALECTAQEIAQLGAENDVELRYVAGRITVQNAADECAALYQKTNGRAFDGQTPATTIA